MVFLLHGLRHILNRYPITRGMLSYSILWPSSNLVQQSMDKSQKEYNFKEAIRYSIMGAFINAPTVFAWIKFNGWLIKGNTITTAIKKVCYHIYLYFNILLPYFLH